MANQIFISSWEKKSNLAEIKRQEQTRSASVHFRHHQNWIWLWFGRLSNRTSSWQGRIQLFRRRLSGPGRHSPGSSAFRRTSEAHCTCYNIYWACAALSLRSRLRAVANDCGCLPSTVDWRGDDSFCPKLDLHAWVLFVPRLSHWRCSKRIPFKRRCIELTPTRSGLLVFLLVRYETGSIECKRLFTVNREPMQYPALTHTIQLTQSFFEQFHHQAFRYSKITALKKRHRVKYAHAGYSLRTCLSKYGLHADPSVVSFDIASVINWTIETWTKKADWAQD